MLDPQRDAPLPLVPMIASHCLDILKLGDFVPFEIELSETGSKATIEEIVFDPLRIYEVNDKYRQAGFEIDEQFSRVIAVMADGSILVWFGHTTIYLLEKDTDKKIEAFNDLLDLTFDFNIKNKRPEINGLLREMRECYG